MTLTQFEYDLGKAIAQPKAEAALPTRRLFKATANPSLVEMEIDNTSLEHFTTCARAAEYRLVHSREGRSNMAAKNFGLGKHHYLEARLRGATTREAEEIMIAFFNAQGSLEDGEWRNGTYAIDGMRAYETYWQHNTLVPLTEDGALLVEVPFRLPLCDITMPDAPLYPMEQLFATPVPSGIPIPWTVRVFWTGKIDLVTNINGMNLVSDHKTASLIGPSFFDDFLLSHQTIGYTWAARHLWPHLDIIGLYLNVLGSRKPSKSGVMHEFHRRVYIYSEAHIEEWLKDTQLLVADFLSHLSRGYFPKETKWCMGKYGTCQYHMTCTALPSARPLAISTALYQDVTWSPLL